ncbi:hypothetical protein Ddc_23145 [Ditylenchus destructor]|nr:hypothetical protein Ddc_23145 [Ditylenchus destructor]
MPLHEYILLLQKKQTVNGYRMAERILDLSKQIFTMNIQRFGSTYSSDMEAIVKGPLLKRGSIQNVLTSLAIDIQNGINENSPPKYKKDRYAKLINYAKTSVVDHNKSSVHVLEITHKANRINGDLMETGVQLGTRMFLEEIISEASVTYILGMQPILKYYYSPPV